MATTDALALNSALATLGESLVRYFVTGVPRRWSPPPFPKTARHRLIDFPIEEIIIARPRVDLGPANLTAETTRMLVWMPLPCRDVRQPAIGIAEKFGRP